MLSKIRANPWPYGLVAVLIAFCVIQFSMVALATSGFEGLEDVEYYRHGVEYGKEIERQDRQRDLGWTVSHNLAQSKAPSESFPLRVALLNADKKPIMHAKVRVSIGRPATMKDDRLYEFKEVGPGVYETNVALHEGNWKLNLEADKGEDTVKVEFRHEVDGQ